LSVFVPRQVGVQEIGTQKSILRHTEEFMAHDKLAGKKAKQIEEPPVSHRLAVQQGSNLTKAMTLGVLLIRLGALTGPETLYICTGFKMVKVKSAF
jgi:hypothetical protein